MSGRGVWIAAMAAAGLVACGRGGSGVTRSVTTHDRPGDPPGTALCTNVALRVLGVAQGDVSAAHLVVGAVSAKLDATGADLLLDKVATGTTIDLSTDLTAFTLGTVRLADLTGPVDVSLGFSGGDGARPVASGAIDVCSSPISFRFDPKQVDATRCEAIVKLDVGRSLVQDRGALAFLPQFHVAF